MKIAGNDGAFPSKISQSKLRGIKLIMKWELPCDRFFKKKTREGQPPDAVSHCLLEYYRPG